MDDNGISLVLTPVQLYAWLNGKSISHAELASNSWHEMPRPSPLDLNRFLSPLAVSSLPSYPDRANAWTHQSHISQPNAPDCWIPPPIQPSDPRAQNRVSASLQIIGGGLETVGGALLILTPEPTMVTKVGGSLLAAHGVDTMQAAIRQLFSGKPVADFTQAGATWAAHQAGASDQTAHRVGVLLDVAVPFAVGAGMVGAEKVVAIRAGRVILSEEAVAGKAGRISLDVEEADKAIGKEGGHTLERHVHVTDADLEARAMRSKDPGAVFSRFTSKEIAEDAVNDTVRANRNAIRQWANKPTTIPKEFEFTSQRAVGTGFSNASGIHSPLTRIRVVFKFARTQQKVLYIVTAYPIP